MDLPEGREVAQACHVVQYACVLLHGWLMESRPRLPRSTRSKKVPGSGFGRVRIRVRQGWLTEQVIMSIRAVDDQSAAIQVEERDR
jgi:hypothetical protein